MYLLYFASSFILLRVSIQPLGPSRGIRIAWIYAHIASSILSYSLLYTAFYIQHPIGFPTAPLLAAYIKYMTRVIAAFWAD